MAVWKMKNSKYGAKKTEVDGIVFDSKKEAKRYKELKLMEDAGEINNLERQVKFVLLPKMTDTEGKCVFRECSYIADFVYNKKDGERVVEDCKGFKTPEYILKKKMMFYFHNIIIQES